MISTLNFEHVKKCKELGMDNALAFLLLFKRARIMEGI